MRIQQQYLAEDLLQEQDFQFQHLNALILFQAYNTLFFFGLFVTFFQLQFAFSE